MIGWIILGVLLGLIVLLLCLHVSVRVGFGETLHVTAAIGPLTMQLVPPPAGKKKNTAPKAEPSAKKAKEKKKKEKPELHLTFNDEVREGLHAVWQAIQGALCRAGQRLRLDPLELCCIFGDENPVNTAQWYGWASAAMWTVMPRLEQVVHVPDPHIHLGMDFDARENRISGQVGIRCRIGDLLSIGFAAAGPLLRFAIPFLKKQRTAKKADTRQAVQTDDKQKNDHAAA